MSVNNTFVKVLTRAMGAMALTSVTIDTCHMGKRRARELSKDGEACDTLRNYIGSSKMDFPSPMYAKMKKRTALMYPHNLMNFLHSTKGFIRGVFDGIVNHADIAGASIFALCAKSRAGQIASGLLLGAVCTYNIIKNGTGLMERKDDFEQM